MLLFIDRARLGSQTTTSLFCLAATLILFINGTAMIEAAGTNSVPSTPQVQKIDEEKTKTSPPTMPKAKEAKCPSDVAAFSWKKFEEQTKSASASVRSDAKKFTEGFRASLFSFLSFKEGAENCFGDLFTGLEEKRLADFKVIIGGLVDPGKFSLSAASVLPINDPKLSPLAVPIVLSNSNLYARINTNFLLPYAMAVRADPKLRDRKLEKEKQFFGDTKVYGVLSWEHVRGFIKKNSQITDAPFTVRNLEIWSNCNNPESGITPERCSDVSFTVEEVRSAAQSFYLALGEDCLSYAGRVVADESVYNAIMDVLEDQKAENSADIVNQKKLQKEKFQRAQALYFERAIKDDKTKEIPAFAIESIARIKPELLQNVSSKDSKSIEILKKLAADLTLESSRTAIEKIITSISSPPDSTKPDDTKTDIKVLLSSPSNLKPSKSFFASNMSLLVIIGVLVLLAGASVLVYFLFIAKSPIEYDEDGDEDSQGDDDLEKGLGSKAFSGKAAIPEIAESESTEEKNFEQSDSGETASSKGNENEPEEEDSHSHEDA